MLKFKKFCVTEFLNEPQALLQCTKLKSFTKYSKPEARFFDLLRKLLYILIGCLVVIQIFFFFASFLQMILSIFLSILLKNVLIVWEKKTKLPLFQQNILCCIFLSLLRVLASASKVIFLMTQLYFLFLCRRNLYTLNLLQILNVSVYICIYMYFRGCFCRF